MSHAQADVDRTTRVLAGAIRSRYDGVAITLHWATVALVLIEFWTDRKIAHTDLSRRTLALMR